MRIPYTKGLDIYKNKYTADKDNDAISTAPGGRVMLARRRDAARRWSPFDPLGVQINAGRLRLSSFLFYANRDT